MTALTAWLPALLGWAQARLDREDGQTGIEYALVAVVIVAAVGAAYIVAGPAISTTIQNTLGLISGLVSNAIAGASA